MLGIDTYNNNAVMKPPLMVATTTSFFTVLLHGLASLNLHILVSVPFHAKSDVTSHSTQARPIKRALVLLVIFLALSVLTILFALAAQSWTQTGCSSDCWVERALVSAVVIGGFASLIATVCRMRWGDGGLAAGVGWS
jgi:hypothetical protein